jgi:hypothetical protein
MVVVFLTGEEGMRALAELLRPEPTADGFESEERLIICGVSWERYLALDKALGDDRPGPRLYYLDGGSCKKRLGFGSYGSESISDFRVT